MDDRLDGEPLDGTFFLGQIFLAVKRRIVPPQQQQVDSATLSATAAARAAAQAADLERKRSAAITATD